MFDLTSDRAQLIFIGEISEFPKQCYDIQITTRSMECWFQNLEYSMDDETSLILKESYIRCTPRPITNEHNIPDLFRCSGHCFHQSRMQCPKNPTFD